MTDWGPTDHRPEFGPGQSIGRRKVLVGVVAIVLLGFVAIGFAGSDESSSDRASISGSRESVQAYADALCPSLETNAEAGGTSQARRELVESLRNDDRSPVVEEDAEIVAAEIIDECRARGFNL